MKRGLAVPLPIALAFTLCCKSPASSNAPPKGVPPAASPKRIPIDDSVHSALFDFITELAKDRPLRATTLSARLGLSFKADDSFVNPYFRIYKADGPAKHEAGAITAAEVREPVRAPKGGPVNGLLILEVSPKPCVGQDAVQRRFGPDPELSVPSPHEPPDSPLYIVYQRDVYKLSFGFSRSEPSCLVSVVIDAIPKR